MPRLSLPLHTALREAVAARFGQPLRYPSHCDALEAELLKAAGTGGRRLSPSTLRRFFGLVEKDGGYHLHTLDTLARYAGHASFEAFGKAVAGLATAETAADSPTDIPELLAMERLAYPERLLLGYFLGRVTRPLAPDGPAAPLALRLAALPAIRQLMVALEPCNSGGFVSPILLASTAQETTVAAACPADGTSRGGSTADPYSPFSRAWISVMNGFGPDGVTVVPAPGPVVTALDAFTYSVVQDFYDRPQYGNQTPTSDGMTLG